MVIRDIPVYPTQPKALRDRLSDLLDDAQPFDYEGEVTALIVPDTNRLSGSKLAARLYKSLDASDYDTVILLAPSHSGRFQRLTICKVDRYRTPLGEVPVDDRLRNELCDEDDDLFVDNTGHFQPAGIDVQVPFLQMLLDDFQIVPIVMGDETPALCRELGSAVGEVMHNRRALVIASANVLSEDAEALEGFRELFETGDVERLMVQLNSESVRLEGRGTVLAALIAAQRWHRPHVKIVALEPAEGGEPGVVGAILSRG